jgi:hypothetical protein
VDDLDWLRMIQKDIWKTIPADPYVRWSKDRQEAKRQFTGSEIERIFKYIDTHDLLVEMYNSCMGFGLGLSVYDMPNYPGADPVFVMAFNSDHIVCPQGTRKFDHAWDILSPIALSRRNLRLHRYQFGKEPTQDRAHYDY